MTENRAGSRSAQRLRSGGRKGKTQSAEGASPQARRPRRRLLRVGTAVGVAIGLTAATGVALAATFWTVGINPGSSANAQGAAIQNLTISKITAAPTLTNQLSPGSSGDVQFTINNPNPFIVTVTAVTIPAESLTGTTANNAAGYTTNALGTPISGCAADSTGGNSPSTVTWKGFSGTATSKTLSSAFTIDKNATITVTLTNVATMDATAPLACAGTSSGTPPNLTYAGAYFVMPALTTVTATGGIYAGQPATTANGGSVTTSY